MKEEVFLGCFNYFVICVQVILDEKVVSDLCYCCKDGVMLLVMCQQIFMLDYCQCYIGDFYIVMDMSLQCQQEVELVVVCDQLMLVVEVVKLGVWVWDCIGDIFEFNCQIVEIYGIGDGCSGQVIIYEGWCRCVYFDDVGYVELVLQVVLVGIGEFELVFCVVCVDGSICFVQVCVYVDCNGMGVLVCVIGINLDIIQCIEFENNLVEVCLKVEQVNFVKSLFLVSVSYEICIFMNGVLGMIQLLQRM